MSMRTWSFRCQFQTWRPRVARVGQDRVDCALGSGQAAAVRVAAQVMSRRERDAVCGEQFGCREDAPPGKEVAEDPRPLGMTSAADVSMTKEKLFEAIWNRMIQTPGIEPLRSMTRTDVIEQRVSKLTGNFGRYVETYDQRVSFTGEQLTTHREAIALRRQLGGVRTAACDDRFAASLRRTLYAWGVGRRASHLVSEDTFAVALRAAAPRLGELESLAIDSDELPADIADRLWQVINSLGVVENKAKLVAGTKTLHHLLPDLVVPMDRKYTGTFLQLRSPEWQDPTSQRRIFRVAYNHFAAVARAVRPQQYVTHEGWRTSRTKILDNALIGFCKLELAGSLTDIDDDADNQICFDVQGYPPGKDGGTSILNARHGRAPLVRLLLEAARAAREVQSFVPIEHGPVALDVVVRAVPSQPTWDSTNYLGGIADVLEDKSHRDALDHLGELARVWLYREDRQIKKISYREVEADEAGYTVTVWSIDR